MFYESTGQKIFKVVNYIILTLLGLITLLPFWYVVVVSLNAGWDFELGGVYFWPREFTINNYRSALRNERIIRALCVSIFTTAVRIGLSVFLTALLAYTLTFKDLPGKKGITLFFYFTTIASGGLIPYYMLLRDIGLTESIWLFVLPFLYNFFNTVYMRSSFESIPTDLREAAQIDGAGDLRILVSVYLPCSVATIATICLFVGVTAWNDWYTGVYYQLDKKLWPIASLLQEFVGGTPTPQEMAYLVISTIPIIIVYPWLQKYYVNGVMLGSIKG